MLETMAPLMCNIGLDYVDKERGNTLTSSVVDSSNENDTLFISKGLITVNLISFMHLTQCISVNTYNTCCFHLSYSTILVLHKVV